MGDILCYRLVTVYAEIIVGPSFCGWTLPSLREKTPNTEVNRWFAVEWQLFPKIKPRISLQFMTFSSYAEYLDSKRTAACVLLFVLRNTYNASIVSFLWLYMYYTRLSSMGEGKWVPLLSSTYYATKITVHKPRWKKKFNFFPRFTWVFSSKFIWNVHIRINILI